MAASPFLELRDLACERDERLLFAKLNAGFYAGQIAQILGPNGSGKTTLLRVLAGVSHDFYGQIIWSGKSLSDHRWDYAKDLCYLGHLPAIKKSLTPLENLRWYGAKDGIEDSELIRALAFVDLIGYENTPCYQLSAGQLRRVALARLEFSKARLWILDEPFTALDKSGVIQLETRLSAHAQNGGLVLLTSHQDIGVANLQIVDLQAFAQNSLDEGSVYG